MCVYYFILQCNSTAWYPIISAAIYIIDNTRTFARTPFCHRILSAEVQDVQSLLVASSCLVHHLCLLGFPRNYSGACWIVGCNVLWCRIRVHVQYMSVLHSLI